MISYDEALALLRDAAQPVAPEQLPLRLAAGCGNAGRVVAAINVPDFDNAAMDGFAVRAIDLAGATPDRPVCLPVTGTVVAGDAPGARLSDGEALEITTGAPAPAGCDAVVPVERVVVTRDATGRPASAEFTSSCESGQHIRRAGEDFSRGTLVLPPGSAIGPHQLMALAASGIDKLLVRPAIPVAIITTGSELSAQGAPTGSGRIRDANGPYLAATLPRLGAEVLSTDTAVDETAAVTRAIEQAGKARVIITTGGVSAGRFDAVPAAVAEAGGEILFHKVAIRPGKPLLCARLPGNRWLFGLPGNPMAVAAGLRFFVSATLRRLQGLEPETWLTAVSQTPIRKRAELSFFGKAVAYSGDDGRILVELLPGQESFRIAPLAAANCWILAPQGMADVPAGALVRIAPLYPDGFLQAPGF